jgi:hypothetical protein
MAIYKNSEPSIDERSSGVQTEGRISDGLVPTNKREDTVELGGFIKTEQTEVTFTGKETCIDLVQAT